MSSVQTKQSFAHKLIVLNFLYLVFTVFFFLINVQYETCVQILRKIYKRN